MKRPNRFLLILPLLFCTSAAIADVNPLEVAERFARSQTQGLPGEVSVRAGPLDPELRLPPCSSAQASLPVGSRLWGKSTVSIRCQAPTVWSILVPVQVSVTGNYVYLARAIAAGQALQPTDLAIGRTDLTSLPAGILADPAAAIGKTLRNSLAAGLPLRSDQLLAPLLIKQGQTVRLIARGNGFTATSEGKSLSNASEGQIANIKTASGQTVSGTVLPDGSVEIVR